MYVESLDFMYEKEWNAKNHDNKRHFKGENNKSTDNKNELKIPILCETKRKMWMKEKVRNRGGGGSMSQQ